MKRKLLAVMAFILCFTMVLGTFALATPAETAAPEESAAPSESPDASESGGSGAPEEVIYGRLDASGRPQSAYAVVALTVDEPGTVTHYGQYTEVENLTDTSPIEYSGGKVTLEAEGSGRYYYQGTLRRALMPWDIEITYTLDGEEIRPRDLGGKSGSLEVSIHTTANSGFASAITDGYMLQISVTLPGELCEDVSARNGTIASAGSDKTIAFVILPGGEGDVSFSAEVHDFTMAGFTIAGMPYDMSSMMGDMEEVDAIKNGLGELSDGIASLTYAAGQLSSGSGELAANSSALTGASDQIAAALNEISAGLQGFDISEMTSGLDQLAQLPAGLYTIAAGLQEMKNGITTAMGQMANITVPSAEQIEQLKGLMGSLSSLSALAGVEEEISSNITTNLTPILMPYILSGDLPKEIIGDLKEAIGSAIMSSSLGSISVPSVDSTLISSVNGMLDSVGQLGALTSQLSQLTGGLDAAIGGLTTMANQVSAGLSAMTDIDTSAIDQLKSGMSQLASQYGEFNSGLKTYTEGVGAVAEGMDSYYGGMFTLNRETSSIPDIIDEVLGGGETEEEPMESFLDEKNPEPASVQFVLSTEGIEAPEEDAPGEPADEPKGFFEELWDKITALFR